MSLDYFEDVLSAYIAYESEKELKDTTLKGKEFSARKVFKYFESIGKKTPRIYAPNMYMAFYRANPTTQLPQRRLFSIYCGAFLII